jgi:hypothetical protein
MSVQPTLLQKGLPNKCWLCALKEIKPSKRHKLMWLEVPIKVDIHFMNHLLASKLVWQSMSWTSKFLVSYGVLMLMAFILTYQWSLNDHRLIRDVGVWVKPMKFMAATALFALTTVWALKVAHSSVDQTNTYVWIVALLVSTSLFEVVYISYQASQAAASHYNISDPFHAFMFGLMAIAAVGLTASQAWLAWEIWKEQGGANMPVKTLGVVIGLTMTFVLSTISGFMLGGNKPPAGQGLPIVGWHFYNDIRPAHFLGVHAQQLIPLWGAIAAKFMGSFSNTGLLWGSVLYVVLWGVSTWPSI